MFKEHSDHVVKSSEVISVDVINPQQEKLGQIEELVIDKMSGQVHYAVLSFGGILGLGDKYFALPWKAITYSPENKSFILNIPKDKLQQAPGFDKSNWPDWSSPEFNKSLHHYYDAFNV